MRPAGNEVYQRLGVKGVTCGYTGERGECR
jgi:hypothetical protein